jgi:hypothetical protein
MSPTGRPTIHIPAPAVGRIVHYGVDNASEGTIKLHAAVITYVFPLNLSGMVNLCVLSDSARPPLWATSVPYGHGHNQWHWPERVDGTVEVYG